MEDKLIIGKKNRTVWLDNLKGIAIILMVLGHSGAPFTHWIFLFHMAVFYIASGYSWNNKHVKEFESLRSFWLSKFKSLYIPYVVCNLLFLFLNNIFIDIGIYASSDEYLRLIGCDDISLLHTKMSLPLIAKYAVSICILNDGTELGGPTWFFASLFVSLCAYAFVEFLLNKAFKQRHGIIMIFEVVISIAFIGIAWMISEDKFNLHFSTFNRLFAAYPLLVIGSCMKLLDKKINWKPVLSISVAVLAFVVLWVLNGYGSISMARCKIENPLYFLTVSLAGWYLLVAVSRLIPQSPLAKLGASTRSIVMWHFISMKTVTFAYILIMGLPLVLLGAFPFLENTTSWMWIVYTIVGIGLPYMLGLIYEAILKDSKYKI